MSLEASLKEPMTWQGWDTKVDACVSRWAQRLAGAPGSTREIGTAALGACTDALESKASAWAREARAEGQDPQPFDDNLARYRKDALDLAMFNVAMARAGNCGVPK